MLALLRRTLVIVAASLAALPAAAQAGLLRSDDTPFAPSQTITGAAWTSPRYRPPANQVGDILPTVWGDDGNEYTMIDDGESDQDAHQVWKQSLARISGVPPAIHFMHIGDPRSPAPATFAQIRHDPSLWTGPLGPYYSSGLVEANHILFATQQLDWSWGTNGPFSGLAGIAYSTDHGVSWTPGTKSFPAPLGNLSWVIRGRGGNYPDGWVYAIATEREFNADRMILGRSRPDVADLTDPARWQWLTGTGRNGNAPAYASSVTDAAPVVGWAAHITYPQMAYDAPLHRYLLTFTWSYNPQPPAVWRGGSELVILSAGHPWGPFRFVARQPEFGPSNGYAAGFPIGWISRDGRSLWLKWAANFAGCAAQLDCSGAYGFNFRRLRLQVAGNGAHTHG